MASSKSRTSNNVNQTDTSVEYSAASSLTYLEGLDGVRKRPGMYIGSVDSRGLTHCVFEIFDNAVDEALAGHCDHIVVTDHGDGSYSVDDNGRGIPVDIEPKSGIPGVILVMTKLHAGGKFGGSGYKVSGGLHGVGASVVNALSTRVDVECRRDGARHEVSFHRGVPGVFANASPDSKFKPAGDVRRIGKVSKANFGTTVRFWPDPEIFLPDSAVDMERVAKRCATTAHLVPGLTITLRTPDGEVDFHDPRGVAGLVEDRVGATAIAPVISCSGSGSFTAPAQVLDGDKLVTKQVERTVDVDVAVCWGEGFDYTSESFTNIVATPGGGSHLTGAERAIVKVVQDAVSKTKLLKASDETPVKEDIFEGMVLCVSVKVPEPEFEGQTKDVLSTPAVTKIVADVVTEGLQATFGGARVKPAARAVCTKVVAAARARKAARDRRDAVRKAKAVSSGPLPAKLRDCRVHDERSELFLVEGDSAAGSVGAARDSKYQAYLPLRGKILNTERVTTKTMLANAECAAIIAAIGGGLGSDFDVNRVRYGKISILVDADVDGSHIRCLLLTLFFNHMPELIEAGKVWASQPPLYRVSTSKGEHHYCYTDADRDRKIAELRAAGVKVADGIQRFKGLGEMNPDQLAVTALEAATRRERLITMADAAAAAAMFDKLMGDDASARRDWLFEFADQADLDSLDV